MEKLLHERLREFENIGKDECALNNFYDLCLDAKNCKECHKTALNALADEIERDYIPREDHDREIKEITEAQGGSFPSAHKIMQKWAEDKGMKWPDNASITEFLEYYYIPRPRFEDGEPLVKGSELEDGIADGWCIWGDGAFEVYDKYSGDVIYGASQPELIKRPSPKVLDADGVEIKVGDTVWSLCHGTKYRVHRLCDSEMVIVSNPDTERIQGWFGTDRLTHKEPDSLEKLLDDMLYDTGLYGTGYATRLSALIERGR